MSETVLTVTEAARNFADCVDRAHYHNTTFLVLKNGVPFARLVPAGQAVCGGRELAEALTAADLPDDEARAWNHDLQTARNELEAPPDKWQSPPLRWNGIAKWPPSTVATSRWSRA